MKSMRCSGARSRAASAASHALPAAVLCSKTGAAREAKAELASCSSRAAASRAGAVTASSAFKAASSSRAVWACNAVDRRLSILLQIRRLISK